MDGPRKKYLILSHVPRWFLPPPTTADNAEDNDNTLLPELPISRAQALEVHIQEEALRCGFAVVKTVRPADVLAQHDEQSQFEQQQSNHHLGGREKEADEALREDLQEMDQAGAVLWVFEKQQ
jgi:hypothetical protein